MVNIVKQVKSYTNNSSNCPLLLQEKFKILFYTDKKELLNKRVMLRSLLMFSKYINLYANNMNHNFSPLIVDECVKKFIL